MRPDAWPALRDVIELFLTDDEPRARALAAQLHDLNSDRQQTEAEIARMIFDQCVEQPVTDADAALVFAGEGWHRGVVGIVASRVVERFHRPAFVLGIENGVAQGSGRSISAFHLLDALEAHAGAVHQIRRASAGGGRYSRIRDAWKNFVRGFKAHAASLLSAADFEAQLQIDSAIEVSEINDRSVADVLSLAPFGFGNPSPVFVARDVEVAAAPEVKKERHVFLRLAAQGRTLRVKAWNFADRVSELSAGARIDAAVCFEDDPYSASRGYAPWATVLRDVRMANPAASSAVSATNFR